MRFLFVGPKLCPQWDLSTLCIQLPSDSTLRWTPLPSASGSCYRARSGLSPPSYRPCRAHCKNPGRLSPSRVRPLRKLSLRASALTGVAIPYLGVADSKSHRQPGLFSPILQDSANFRGLPHHPAGWFAMTCFLICLCGKRKFAHPISMENPGRLSPSRVIVLCVPVIRFPGRSRSTGCGS